MTGDAPSNANDAANGMRASGASRPESLRRDVFNNRVQMQIGRELRAMYDAVVGEAVPDELLDLLRQADLNAKTARPGTE